MLGTLFYGNSPVTTEPFPSGIQDPVSGNLPEEPGENNE